MNILPFYRCAVMVLVGCVFLVSGCAEQRVGSLEVAADAKRRNAAAVALIESHGGVVTVNDAGVVVTIQRTDKKTTKQSVKALVDVINLDSLYLASVDAAGLNLDELEGAHTLRSITVTDVELSDKDIASLLGHWNLRGVHLYKTGLTNQQLDGIAALPWLRDVTIGYGQVTDSGLSSLQRAKGLRSVRLVKAGVSLLAAQGLCDANDWLTVNYDGVKLRGYRAGE